MNFFFSPKYLHTALTKGAVSGYCQPAAQEYLAKVELEKNSIYGEFVNLHIYVRVAGMQLRFPEQSQLDQL